ncbi:MAG: hypothetical protein IJQ83_00120 [Bacteroidales bacterium]|nr:hypothetical protein [Bacteroidales bacterium]
MKKVVLLLFVMFGVVIASLAQNKVYAEIVGNEYSGAGSVKVEFGKNSKRFAYMLNDENGKKIYFGTMVDAMNQLAKFGWEIETTYVDVDGDLDRVASEYHWIISRNEEDNKKEEKGG